MMVPVNPLVSAMLVEATCSFLAFQTRNNHSESILIKSLFGLLDNTYSSIILDLLEIY